MARDEVVNTMPTTGAVGKMAKQILAQGTTGKWGGEGFGSAEKNAYDMAVMLAGQGFKDINDFGKVTKYEPVQEIYKTYNGQQVITQTDEEGKTVNYVRQPTGEYQYDYETGENRPVLKTVFVPPDAKLGSVYGQYDGYETVTPVDQSKITFKDGQAVVAVGETFGNKVTGTAVTNTYGERQTGNAFGGTYAGKGNTGYRVQFNADGSPIFYTTAASSSDVDKLAPILAIASFIPGVAPFAQAINAAISIKNGDILETINGNQLGDFSQALKLFEQLKSERSLRLVLERNMQPITYNYVIR
jgi:hypothetical protein